MANEAGAGEVFEKDIKKDPQLRRVRHHDFRHDVKVISIQTHI